MLEKLVLPDFFRQQVKKPSEDLHQELNFMALQYASGSPMEEMEDRNDADQFAQENQQHKNFVTVGELHEQLSEIKVQLEKQQSEILRRVADMVEKSLQQPASQQQLPEASTGAVNCERNQNSSEKTDVCEETTQTEVPVTLMRPVAWQQERQEHDHLVLQGIRIEGGKDQKGDTYTIEGSSCATHHESSSLITGHQIQATQRMESCNSNESPSDQQQIRLAELQGMISQLQHQLDLSHNKFQQLTEQVAKCCQMCDVHSQKLCTAFQVLEGSLDDQPSDIMFF